MRREIRKIDDRKEQEHLRGGVVLDPFSGSGTTCAAAKKLGRHFLGFEIEERFWKASRERIGKTAEGEDEQMKLF